MSGECITMAHGGGGRSMQRLIQEVLLPAYGNPATDGREDQALLPWNAPEGTRLAFTTDSFVVDPLFFPGGDIGALAVHGTINDLACGGAEPLALSCSMILEEGLDIALLRRIAESIGRCSRDAGVPVVTGDTKVVARGAADKIFITTSGVGRVASDYRLSSAQAQAGDVVLVSGPLGNHGATIMCARGDMALQTGLRSDTAALHRATARLLDACPETRCMRDATRGGLAAILNEIATASGLTIRLQEGELPIDEQTRGVCELLGLDPLYLANEGVFAAIIPATAADRALHALAQDPVTRHARVVGNVSSGNPGLVLQTGMGGERMLDLLSGEQLPRIC